MSYSAGNKRASGGLFVFCSVLINEEKVEMPKQHGPAVVFVAKPSKVAANDDGKKGYLRQYPKNSNFENVWRWPEVMEAKGVKPRP
ncbi:hypothetical protein A3I46_03240 [Candidatus Kaiserbacteria bacterium RIFCSPLOWO2_02_FULL_54_13]|uniref:Uncharacterized protein n=1 Tax=Candidatus Kaiserbacteria bacterium RIFCSPHIGHO2_02_FULL_54_22 TaxID=1798495 RepID=A0A1F6DLT1_9BACT|nr:MAG: hypothetical protein A3C19_00335 [Candidatus Kaiserbacteria bacterium RIFCSPHIGHO2_02_FULL_54_22]OGG68097.1 MAG: hypothetical protein A3E99_02420 [Candidatus Kaiserbacteria bacterium RIFCSPHIGHO2_12_FULL_54_16]OGG83137.1 MAG: hypothetical protein A3I46_03240 [Candidatus Kaiserbacteria bacterium RIFCSPLOWO2_02_FULL_54_13]OGG90259.1 MAG: hypothetical protein A3G12_01725 [Candidatus Kaiserbacteria bacterium RIFCSPLOWO2_12_FULL_54_10]